MTLTPTEIKELFTAELANVRSADADTIAELRTRLGSLETSGRRASIYGGEMNASEMSPEERKRYARNSLGNGIRALAASHGDYARAANIVENRYKDERTATHLRAMSEGVSADGGSLVEPEFASDVIELLLARAVVRQSGATVLPMPTGNLTIHRVTQNTTAAYEGELQQGNLTGIKTGNLTLNAKKLFSLVPVSNELLTDTSGRANDLVVRDLGRQMSLREDTAFLRGNGTNNTPTGILNLVPVENKVSATTLAGALAALEGVVFAANIPDIAVGWVFHSRVETALKYARTTTGAPLFPEMAQGQLRGHPYKISNQIPTNLGAGGKTTEIYFGDWSEAIIGDTQAPTIEASREASYVDASGNHVNTFAQDATLIRAISRHDFGVRHAEAFAVATVDTDVAGF